MSVRSKFGSAPLQVDAPVAGDRAYARFIKGKSSRYLTVTMKGLLTIATPVTAILGTGSIFQALDSIGIDEGGKDNFVADPRLFSAVTEALALSSRTKTRVTSLSASPVQLVEQIHIPFELLFAGDRKSVV